MSRRLYVLISGFGAPHWEHKISILRNNLSKICSYSWDKVDITITQYSSPDEYKIPEDILEAYPIRVIYEKGVVGQFIKRHATPEMVSNYDYVLLMLDDIELEKIDFGTMIRYQKEFSFDILTPSLTPESKYQYRYILQENNPFHIKIANVCEYFCMFFPSNRYSIYYHGIQENNPWMWGLDLILYKHLGLHIGILNQMCMTHWYKTESYAYRPDINPVDGFKRCLETYGENMDELAKQPAIRYYVIDPFVRV